MTSIAATVQTSVADVGTVLGRAARLLWRHWPVVLAILLAGEAARHAALWAAVELSDISGTLGVLVLVLAPLSAVSALIAALYALRHSLRCARLRTPFDAVTPGTGGRGTARVIAGVLVPFLVIYESYGYLSEDIFRFVNSAVADELFGVDAFLGTETIDTDRTALATGWMALLVVATALVLRFGLGVLARRRRGTGLMWAIAYLEALWLVTLARILIAHVDAAAVRLRQSPAVRTIVDGWLDLVAAAGPVGDVIHRGVRGVPALMGSVDAVIVAPLAWLAVGAVVYGRGLGEPVRPPGAHRGARADPLAVGLPAPVRAAGRELATTVTEPFGDVGAALRRLARTGPAVIAMFALAFMAAQRLEYVLDLAWREILGPMPLGTMLAFSPHTSMISHAVATTVVVCLLAAAVDHVLEHDATPARRETPGAGGPAHGDVRNAR
ncbi:hypothetical protein [Phytoactinopolyspora halotolerans]|uniref:Uncharacterized protein n=1 Tax=Phytoactinopolyspora halotolerans TaxID=1981512 RepID=A0A6L9SAC1_9ACTN|nr:hypothetical protein [Phytoactinopolyspora halotolerans]NEE00910.1 hypothetical protein [Phytoactinopolyspora halotolerans]